VNKPICIDKDPLELSIEEIEHLNIEECVWSTYRELVMRKPRRKIYWQKEIEYREGPKDVRGEKTSTTIS